MDIKNYRYRLPKELQEGCELFLAPLPGYNQNPGLSIWPDISGHGRHGVIHGATWELGKWGWELNFDGVDDYVTTSLSSPINNDDDLTYAAVINRLPGGYAEQHIIECGNSQFYIVADSEYKYLAYKETATIISLGATPVGVYYLVAANRNMAGQSRTYRSTRLQSIGDIGPENLTADVVIGQLFVLSGNYNFCGNIPFAAIWSRALTEEQIKILNEFIEGTKR